MKKIILLALATFSSLSFSQESTSLEKKIGLEVGGMYLSQNGGGNTTTALPMVNYKLLTSNRFELRVQLGATAYLDDATDDKFFVGVARFNPLYHIGETKASVEGLLGAQYWEEGSSVNLDLGGRLNYNISEITKNYLDEAFVGGGIISHDESVTYVTVGIKKWF